MSRCRSCNAEITWAKTANGNNIPLDPEPTPEGNIWLVDGVARVLKDAEKGSIFNLYVSHFATCPDAAKHRRKP